MSRDGDAGAGADTGVGAATTGGAYKTLAEIWTEVLGAEVDREADFFLLGGHSLLATQMIVRIEARLGVRVPLRDVLRHPVLGDFAELVDGLRRSAGAAAVEA